MPPHAHLNYHKNITFAMQLLGDYQKIDNYCFVLKFNNIPEYF